MIKIKKLTKKSYVRLYEIIDAIKMKLAVIWEAFPVGFSLWLILTSFCYCDFADANLRKTLIRE